MLDESLLEKVILKYFRNQLLRFQKTLREPLSLTFKRKKRKFLESINFADARKFCSSRYRMANSLREVRELSDYS